MIWIIIGAVAIFIFGFLVGRNNPNIEAVNKLIAAGDAVVKTTADGIIAVQKVVKGKP